MNLKRVSFALFGLLFCCSIQANPDSKQALQNMLEENKGKVVYLDFWASWCVPCRKSFPWMNQMQTRYQDKGFTVITVNLDVEKSYADEFLAEVPANFPILFDPKGNIAKAFKLKGMPSSYLFDKNGEVVAANVGFFDEKIDQYEAKIKQYLQLQD
ncbi:TlpA disulfide reductase family protein [Thalassotalea aquiviva]|uniref:TlpA disulfide reductase family protein n=1 Tax=Thalassotalea aquiviva TaxID=3242415 RepID=UPI00352A5A35